MFATQRSSAFGIASTRQGSAILRHGRLKLPLSPTPPTWYRKNALMYGQYGEVFTNLPHSRQCCVYEKELWSMVLQKKVRVKVSGPALREIDRKGGLDEYVMFTSEKDLGGSGSVGTTLREMVTKKLHERFGSQAGVVPASSSASSSSSDTQKTDFNWRKALDAEFWVKLHK